MIIVPDVLLCQNKSYFVLSLSLLEIIFRTYSIDWKFKCKPIENFKFQMPILLHIFLSHTQYTIYVAVLCCMEHDLYNIHNVRICLTNVTNCVISFAHRWHSICYFVISIYVRMVWHHQASLNSKSNRIREQRYRALTDKSNWIIWTTIESKKKNDTHTHKQKYFQLIKEYFYELFVYIHVICCIIYLSHFSKLEYVFSR